MVRISPDEKSTLEVVHLYYDSHPFEIGELLCDALRQIGLDVAHRQFDSDSIVDHEGQPIFQIFMYRDTTLEIAERFMNYFPDVSFEGLFCDNFGVQRRPGNIDGCFALTLVVHSSF